MKENPFLCLRRLYEESETEAIHQTMLQWMEGTLAWVDDVLTACPPAWPEPEIRRRALYLLDEPLHVLSAPIEPPVADFLNRRIQRAVGEMENEQVTSGMTLWKLYNHGFVVKTPEVTIGFDLHQGPFETLHKDQALPRPQPSPESRRCLPAVCGLRPWRNDAKNLDNEVEKPESDGHFRMLTV